MTCQCEGLRGCGAEGEDVVVWKERLEARGGRGRGEDESEAREDLDALWSGEWKGIRDRRGLRSGMISGLGIGGETGLTDEVRGEFSADGVIESDGVVAYLGIVSCWYSKWG